MSEREAAERLWREVDEHAAGPDCGHVDCLFHRAVRGRDANLCAEYDNPATLRTIEDLPARRVEWVERPAKCHVATELLDEDEAGDFIEHSYALTKGCRPDVLHADLLDGGAQ